MAAWARVEGTVDQLATAKDRRRLFLQSFSALRFLPLQLRLFLRPDVWRCHGRDDRTALHISPATNGKDNRPQIAEKCRFYPYPDAERDRYAPKAYVHTGRSSTG